jgi:beta-xylosidase
VELENGESWFVHFQELGAYGRLVHLNPMKWHDGWPSMGVDLDGNGVGEPVTTYNKPNLDWTGPPTAPVTTDEFSSPQLAPPWQWQGNWSAHWASLTARPGWLRLNAVDPPAENLTDVTNQLLQKFPSPSFTATTLIEVPRDADDIRAGLVVMGQSYGGLLVTDDGGDLKLNQISNENGWSDVGEEVHSSVPGLPRRLWLRVEVDSRAECVFSFSTDGLHFTFVGKPFTASPGRWIGAKVGVVSLGSEAYADFDSFYIE